MYKLENDIHVWQFAAAGGEFSLLTEDEKQFANKFHFEGDGIRFSVGRHGLRTLLSKYLAIDPSTIVISNKPGEKPCANYLPAKASAKAGQSSTPIHFNISHSGEWVLIAISKEEVGIDIEKISQGFEYKDLLEDHFSEAEQEYITQSKDPVEAFYYLWTRKEALTKAWGTGLQENLKAVSVLPSTINHKSSTFIGHRWKLETIPISQNYSAAVACPVHTNQIILRLSQT